MKRPLHRSALATLRALTQEPAVLRHRLRHLQPGIAVPAANTPGGAVRLLEIEPAT
jgi:hypothetical protein